MKEKQDNDMSTINVDDIFLKKTPDVPIEPVANKIELAETTEPVIINDGLEHIKASDKVVTGHYYWPVFENKERGDGSKSVISLKNITHIFNEGTETEYKLFDNFNLDFPDIPGNGQLFSIMGQSGCGKSQMLKAIAGLSKFNSGTVEYYGKQIDEKWAAPMVFQTYSNFEWMTVADNIALPMIIRGVSKEDAKKAVQQLLELVGLPDSGDKYPAALSGGQNQRVAICKALACNSHILLFDEATGALDIKMKREVQNIILKIFYESQFDPTILNVTHSVEEACYISNKIYILQANPCRVYKVVDIYYPGEETQQRGPWVFETKEYADYVKMITKYMDEICV